MDGVLVSLISTLLVSFRSRLVLHAEILALRHQLNILQRSSNERRRLGASDRILWYGCRSFGLIGDQLW